MFAKSSLRARRIISKRCRKIKNLPQKLVTARRRKKLFTAHGFRIIEFIPAPIHLLLK
jgi:hypothetical protein